MHAYVHAHVLGLVPGFVDTKPSMKSPGSHIAFVNHSAIGDLKENFVLGTPYQWKDSQAGCRVVNQRTTVAPPLPAVHSPGIHFRLRHYGPYARSSSIFSAELSHSLKVSDCRRNTLTSGQNRSESLCAGLWAPCQVLWAWFVPALGPKSGSK